MSDLMVAKTYKDAQRLKEYEKNGKMYATIKIPCDRCGGTGIYAIGVENGHIKPHPAYGGICLACGGDGYSIKDVRLYTEREYNQMEKAKVNAAAKKKAEQEQRMKEEFAANRTKWLDKNNFSEDEFTYIVTGETYSIKDELKAAGWRYDSVLKWHKADPAGYEDRVIKVSFNEIFEWSAWGEGHYKTGAYQIIEDKLKAVEPESNSEYLQGEKVDNLKVRLVRRNSFNGRYGITYIYTFETEEENVCVWFTSKILNLGIDDKCLISGKIKDRQEYNGTKQTVLTRCRVKEA